MTDERTGDDVVSATYRQLSAERSPEILDEAVLRMASEHAQHARYSRAITWTRPLAWAATIVLCLAITFEVTRVPAPESIPAETDAGLPAEAASAPAAAAPLSAPLREKQESPDGREEVLSDDEDATGRTSSKRAADPAAAGTVFESLTKETELLRQAEEMVRLQNGSNNEPAMRQRTLRTFASDSNSVIAPCPDEVRAEPESWLQCIEALEEMGASEAAAIERKSLLEVFPDFKLP